MRILMICLGNICRSPLAEGILRKLTLNKNIIVDSAGTSSYHIGENPDSRMILTARKFSIDISNLKARKFSTSDFDKFDLIYAMDSSNHKDIIKLARNNDDCKKVKLISKNDIPDPFYENIESFEKVYFLLENACKKIIETIE